MKFEVENVHGVVQLGKRVSKNCDVLDLGQEICILREKKKSKYDNSFQ